ncbi:MAG: hypothetical protein JW722_06615 [Demequinaceae bacterium]|nr:hypothetical protein [Demequinaceae bacterium]
MAQIRSSGWWMGLTAILAAIFLGGVTILTFWGWPEVAPNPEPTVIFVTASPPSTAIDHPAPLEAEPLTPGVLDAVDTGWILVEYDSSAGRYGPPLVTVTPAPSAPGVVPSSTQTPGTGPWEWEIPGPRYLYVIDPSGAAYEAGDLGNTRTIRLALWLPDLRTVIVEETVAGGTALRSFDLITGALSDRFPSPKGSGVWVDPELRIANDDQGMLVVHGGATSRSIELVGFDGDLIATPVESVTLGGFLESTDGTILVTVEGNPGSGQQIVSYSAPGTSIFPVSTPSPEPSPSPSESPDSSGYERFSHGMPAGEEDCAPVSWPEGRQLLVACLHEDGSTVLYTLALLTSTFVDVTTLPPGEAFLLFNGGGDRVARGSIVVSALGETAWSMPPGEPVPEGLAWAGEYLISWGDADSPPRPGFGYPSVVARHSTRGELSYVLVKNKGAAGFDRIVVAPQD